MATLGEWHHRPGGKWRVWRSEFVLWKLWFVVLRGYQWTAESSGTVTIMRGRWFGGLEINPCDDGHAPFAWLARRRAIAALKRMRRDTDERMASRCGEKAATGGA